MKDSNEKNNVIKVSLNKVILIILAVISLAIITVIGVKYYNSSEVFWDKYNENNIEKTNPSHEIFQEIDENENCNEDDKEETILETRPAIDQSSLIAYKPVIYLYPEKTTEVSVKLESSEKLTCSYPKYKEEGWKVIAEPYGKLIDINTGRELYCLYWEGLNTNRTDMNEGFVVKGEDTIEFLEEKLEILGLNEKEAEEFIIYWLPQMEDNKYNYIRFETIEEINANMPLQITPVPETIIRINMQWKALNEYIEVKEQVLEKTRARTGFTVVEWGGTTLN